MICPELRVSFSKEGWQEDAGKVLSIRALPLKVAGGPSTKDPLKEGLKRSAVEDCTY